MKNANRFRKNGAENKKLRSKESADTLTNVCHVIYRQNNPILFRIRFTRIEFRFFSLFFKKEKRKMNQQEESKRERWRKMRETIISTAILLVRKWKIQYFI